MEQKIKFPRSQKVYLPGKLYPNIRVAMRKVEQVPSVSFEGEEKIATPNPEIYVYDTSGPFSDADMSIDLKKGLPRMREEWKVSITYVSSTSLCPIALKKEKQSLKWHTPKEGLSPLKWNM